MKLKNVIFSIITLLLLILGTASWCVGSYFVDFAFKRGNSRDPYALPPGSRAILSAKLPPHPKPNYRNEVWTLELNKEKRTATAFYADTQSQKWIVMVHGYCRDQRYTWYYAAEYLAHGYNVLTPDLNASGKSDGRYLTMGVKESEDIQKWSELLASKSPDSRIALHGISMGAATVMLAAQRPLPKQVYAVIEDCGYTSAYDMFAVKLDEVFGLPSFPILNIVNLVQRVKTGTYLSDAAPKQNIKAVKVPLLFIHGSRDSLIPATMADELYDACGSSAKEKLIIPNAGHARSMSTNPQVYFATIYKFLNKQN